MQFLSGVVNGRTTGTAIALMIENQNTRSGDYAKTADLLRPGHADYTAYAKYHGYQDARGGGHFSPRHRRAGGGRCSGAGRSEPGRDRDRDAHRAVCRDRRYPLCAGRSRRAGGAGRGTAEQVRGLCPAGRQCGGTHESCHPCRRCRGRQCGRRAETAILGLPAGVGEPYFDSVESKLAHLAFSIPAVKGIEFGSGFGFADQKGSEANDAFRMQGSASSPPPTTMRA